MPTMDTHGNINRNGVPSFGQTDVAHWLGGKAIVRIAGEFASAGGVSTAVEFHHRVARADGVTVPGHLDGKTFREPGVYEIDFPPGPYYFHASGPSLNGTNYQLITDGQRHREDGGRPRADHGIAANAPAPRDGR